MGKDYRVAGLCQISKCCSNVLGGPCFDRIPEKLAMASFRVSTLTDSLSLILDSGQPQVQGAKNELGHKPRL